MKNYVRENKAITLIALVITIIVLLILAGIMIASLTGNNGLLVRAADAKIQTEIAEEKEILQTAVLAAISKEEYGVINKYKLDIELDNYSEVDNIEEVEDGIQVSFKSQRTYLIDENGNVNEYSSIIVNDLVVKDGSTVLEQNCKSIEYGKALTINFNASISNGIISRIEPNVEYITNGEMKKTFTIIGKNSDGKEVRKNYTVNLKGYYNVPDIKIGDYVNYENHLKTPSTTEITALNSEIKAYSGNSSDNTEFTQDSTLKWRVLEEENGIPTKLVSEQPTGMLYLYGANGYNNAVYLLGKISKTLYNSDKAQDVRSITEKDLSSHLNSNGKSEIVSSSGYGSVVRYQGEYANYPLIAKEENGMGIDTEVENNKNVLKTDGINESQQDKLSGTTKYEASTAQDKAYTNGITVTKTYYKISNILGKYEESVYDEMFHSKVNTSYWLASRCINMGSDNCVFSLFMARNGTGNAASIISQTLFGSQDWPKGGGNAVRPIIILQSNVEVDYAGKKDNKYNMWNIN